MKKKEITICGKSVTMAYCYATEIAYNIMTDEDINDFMIEAGEHITDNRMPNIRKSIFAILASINAYYESQGTESPITDKELMTEASPEDVCNALGTVIGLRSQFYFTPKAATTTSDASPSGQSPEEDDEKNAPAPTTSTD